jgi:hypothetical protein
MSPPLPPHPADRHRPSRRRSAREPTPTLGSSTPSVPLLARGGNSRPALSEPGRRGTRAPTPPGISRNPASGCLTLRVRGRGGVDEPRSAAPRRVTARSAERPRAREFRLRRGAVRRKVPWPWLAVTCSSFRTGISAPSSGDALRAGCGELAAPATAAMPERSAGARNPRTHRRSAGPDREVHAAQRKHESPADGSVPRFVGSAQARGSRVDVGESLAADLCGACGPGRGEGTVGQVSSRVVGPQLGAA